MKGLQQVGRLTAGLGVLAAFAGTAGAQSITPERVEATINVGETFTIKKTITLGATGATNVDLFFLADNTGSMGTIVQGAKTGAAAILNNFGDGFQFGVARYYGEPNEYNSSNPTSPTALASAFTYQQGLTTDKTSVQTAINAWNATGGGDFPEGNFYALQQVANTTSWREGAERVIVWFGDAPSHQRLVTQQQAIAALNAQGITVLAFNSQRSGFGLDACHPTITPNCNQASAIVNATGGSLTNNFSGATDFVSIVSNAISDATSTLDLNFFSTYLGDGLSIAFRCTDIRGCNGVEGGQSRDFEVDITGLAPGTYNFNIGVRGVDALETDIITVRGASVPEPNSFALMGMGLVALGGFARRRRTA